MFYYCSRCANIKKEKTITQLNKCDICGNDMKEVPKEYLMPNGNFFISQDIRNQFLESVKSGDEFDQELSDRKKEILEEKNKKEKALIEEKNEEIRAKEFHVTCPACGSQSVKKISAVGKYGKVYVFGILGADTLGKTYKCNICGTKF